MMMCMDEKITIAWNRDPQQDPTAALLVMLHGFGASEKDLLGLIPGLPSEFVVASVRAPQSEGQGFRWYPLNGDDAFDPVQAQAAVSTLIPWLREQAQGRSSVTVLGFSQGMSIATSLVRAMPGEIDAVVGLSGFIFPEVLSIFNDQALQEKPFKFFWGRDPQDPVLPQELVDISAQWLVDHADVTKVQYQGMGHSISPQEIGHVNEYLRYNVLKAS